MSLLSITRTNEVSYRSIPDYSTSTSTPKRRGNGSRSRTTRRDNAFALANNDHNGLNDEIRTSRRRVVTPAQQLRQREQRQAMELLYSRTFERPLFVATFPSQAQPCHNNNNNNNNNTPIQSQTTQTHSSTSLESSQQQQKQQRLLTCQFCNNNQSNTFTTEHELLIHQMKCESNVCAPLALQQQMQLSTNEFRYDDEAVTNSDANNHPTDTLFYLMSTPPPLSLEQEQQQPQSSHENRWYNSSPLSVLTTNTPTNTNTKRNKNKKNNKPQKQKKQNQTTTTNKQ